MNTFNLSLDLDKRGEVAQWITLRQGDRNGTELRATIYDHGTQVGSGYTCRVVIRRPDVAEYYRETCEYSSGVATVTVDEQYAAAISGSTYGYFELLQGGSVIASTESFGVRILPDATADATVGPEYDSAIDDALAELDEATGRINQMVIDATAEYLEAHPEITTTVEDNSLTDAKLIQHGGILDRVARLMYRLDNLLTSTPAESDSLTVTDAAKTPMAGLALYGRSTQDGTPTPSAPVAIQSVEPDEDGNVSLLAQGRNLVKRTDVTHTTNGITFTVNADGSVTANGTATATAFHNYTLLMYLPAGTYTLSGSPAGGSSSKWQNKVQIVGGADLMVDTGAGKTVTTTEGLTVRPLIRIASGCVCSNVTFYPMLEVGSTATAYQPYAESVTPIPLQGHELRSLPDGTRDEVVVDQYGHAILTQRVGEIELDGSSDEPWYLSGGGGYRVYSGIINGLCRPNTAVSVVMPLVCNRFTAVTAVQTYNGTVGVSYQNDLQISNGSAMNVQDWRTWLASNPITVLYPLATPVTIDLGTVDPIALQGPDMTAQSVPTAPFALTYERDLNTTLARLEAAIADAATA